MIAFTQMLRLVDVNVNVNQGRIGLGLKSQRFPIILKMEHLVKVRQISIVQKNYILKFVVILDLKMKQLWIIFFNMLTVESKDSNVRSFTLNQFLLKIRALIGKL